MRELAGDGSCTTKSTDLLRKVHSNWRVTSSGQKSETVRRADLLTTTPNLTYLSGIMGEPKVNLFHNIRII